MSLLNIGALVRNVAQAAQAVVADIKATKASPQHVLAQRETLAAVAARYGTSVQSIRESNPGLPPYTEPPVGTILQLPADAVERAQFATRAQRSGAPTPGASGSSVDEAVRRLTTAENDLAALRASIAGGNRAEAADLGHFEVAVAQARTALRQAIGAEVDAGAQARPTGNMRDAAAVRSTGAIIAERYAGDSSVRATIIQETEALAVEREVEDCRTILLAQTDPAAMGRLLADELPKLSAEARNRLLSDPKLRDWVSGDFDDIDPSAITNSDQQRAASAQADRFTQRLADVTAQLPPEQAEALTRSLMPQIRKAGDDKLIPGNQDAADRRFGDLSRIAGRVGDTSAANALVEDIAEAYARVLGNGSFVSRSVENATIGVGGPRLAVAIAENVKVRDDVPITATSDIMAGVQSGIGGLKGQVDFDMKQYGEHMGKVDAAVQSLEGLPGAAEARQRYIESQPQAFRDKMNGLADRAADSGNKLMRAVAGLSEMPPELDRDTNLQETLRQVGEDRMVQSALVLGAQKDPGALLGAQGKQAIEVLTGVKMGKEGAEFVRGYGSLVVGINHAAALDMASRGDVGGARATLAVWADPALGERLGIDPKIYTGLTSKLDEAIQVAGDPVKVTAKLGEMRSMIDGGGELMAPSTNSGRLFRGLNLAASISLAGKSLNEALKEGGWDKWLSAAGDTSGVLKDGSDLISALAGKGAATSTKWFLGGFGAISVAADVGKIFTGESQFDKSAAAISAMGGGFMIAAGALGGPAGMAFAFMGASLTIIIEWAKGENEQKKQLMELNKMSGEALQLLVDNGLDPAAIPALRRRGGDSGEFAAAPVLTHYLTGRGYSPEAALQWINEAARAGKLDRVMDIAVELSTEIASDPETSTQVSGRMDEAVRTAGLVV